MAMLKQPKSPKQIYKAPKAPTFKKTPKIRVQKIKSTLKGK